MNFQENPSDSAGTVTAIFENTEAADAAAADLLASGFSAAEVRVVTASSAGNDALQGAAGTGREAAVEDTLPAAASAEPHSTGELGRPGGGLPFTADAAGASGFVSAMGVFDVADERAGFPPDIPVSGRAAVRVRAGEKAAVARAILARNGGKGTAA